MTIMHRMMWAGFGSPARARPAKSVRFEHLSDLDSMLSTTEHEAKVVRAPALTLGRATLVLRARHNCNIKALLGTYARTFANY